MDIKSLGDKEEITVQDLERENQRLCDLIDKQDVVISKLRRVIYRHEQTIAELRREASDEWKCLWGSRKT